MYRKLYIIIILRDILYIYTVQYNICAEHFFTSVAATGAARYIIFILYYYVVVACTAGHRGVFLVLNNICPNRNDVPAVSNSCVQ